MTRYLSRSPEETFLAGERLAKSLTSGSIVALSGDLGAGKTIFTKGIAKGLGVSDYRHVNSPSFVIVKEYKGKIPLYHFDVYRLSEPCDLETVGYKEYFYGQGVSVIEWAEKVRELLPEKRIEITIRQTGDTKRTITIIREL